MCSHVCSQSMVTAKTERKTYLEVLCQDDRDVDSKKNENEQMRGPTITRRGVMGPQTLLRKKRAFLSPPAPATWVLTGPPWVLTVPSLGAHCALPGCSLCPSWVLTGPGWVLTGSPWVFSPMLLLSTGDTP